MTNKVVMQGIHKAYERDKPVIEELNLEIGEGSFTVMLGPSGCGKSTILRMIAGLEKETAGTILIDGKDMRSVKPGDRNIAMVFQNYALYPTMTVRENMEFGLKNMKVPKEERQKRIHEISEMVGLTEYLGRKPQTLSGGQRQRVALARAIVKKPAVFLMDEPLSNLDAKLRNQIRTELIELHRTLQTTFIYVTHDQVEAMSMGTDIVLLQLGRILQKASPYDLYHHPANVFTARFIGSPPMNIIARDTKGIDGREFPDGIYYLGFRPEHVQLGEGCSHPDKYCLKFEGELRTQEMLGSETLYKINTSMGQVQVKLFEVSPLHYGPIQACVHREKLYYFDRDGRYVPDAAAKGAE